MIWILYFLLAFMTVFLSMKLSYYADAMSKKTNINNALIGGILLAGITSLPELVTCYSAIMLDNIYLAIGDILGSNLFNISIMCFLDIIFIKKMFFNKVSKSYYYIYLILLINYICMYLFFIGNISLSIFKIGIPSILIIFTYFIYLKKVMNSKILISNENKDINNKMLIFKFIIAAIFMIISSIMLTFVVNTISSLNPNFSSSVLGAILLGITTSLPEVITFITLLKLNNHNLALSEIIGSNLFNILVLAIGDFILIKDIIYNYSDSKIMILINLCIITTIINLFQSIKGKSISKLTYIIPSIIIVICYLFFLFN